MRRVILSIKKSGFIGYLGKSCFYYILFFLIYFLFLAEWYGRTEVTEEYRYNLELFKEIRRFLTYREQQHVYGACEPSPGEYYDLCSLWFLYFHGGKVHGIF